MTLLQLRLSVVKNIKLQYKNYCFLNFYENNLLSLTSLGSKCKTVVMSKFILTIFDLCIPRCSFCITIHAKLLQYRSAKRYALHAMCTAAKQQKRKKTSRCRIVYNLYIDIHISFPQSPYPYSSRFFLFLQQNVRSSNECDDP